MSSIAALLAPLLSMAILAGTPFATIALSKKRLAAAMSRTLGREQKVHGLALLVDGAVEVFPDTLDLDIRLVHTPAAADWALVLASHFLDKRQEADSPPIDR